MQCNPSKLKLNGLSWQILEIQNLECYIDGLMKPHGSVRAVRRWCSVCVDPVHGCFDNLEGLNNGYLPSGHSPRVCELANGLRLGTTISS
jgi:hypothetical protein